MQWESPILFYFFKFYNFFFSVFKYLADKYLQRLKRQTAEEPEVVHTTSNKMGKHPDNSHVFS